MTRDQIRDHVSDLIDEARQSRIQPAAHIMHILAGNIEAGNLVEPQTIADLLLEASSRADRELASHPLPEGYGWCPGCGTGTAVLVGPVCPDCRREKATPAGAATNGENESVPQGWRHIVDTLHERALEQQNRVRGERQNGELVLLARAPIPDELAGAMAAGRHLARETCERCGAPGERRENAAGELMTRCEGCREPGSWRLPKEWRATGRMIGRGCCDLRREQVDALLDDAEEGDPVLGPESRGWRHLLRTLVLWVLDEHDAGRDADFYQLEAWGPVLNMRARPLSKRAGGSALFLSDMSRTTCAACGRRGRIRSRTPAEGTWRVACDDCQAGWKRTHPQQAGAESV